MASLLRLALGHFCVAPSSQSDVDGDLDCGRNRGDAIDAAPRETSTRYRRRGDLVTRTVVTRRVDGVENEGTLLDAAAARYQTQGVKEVPSSLAHWRKKIGVETTWKSMVCLIQASFETPHLA